jgi:hypothetical protein
MEESQADVDSQATVMQDDAGLAAQTTPSAGAVGGTTGTRLASRSHGVTRVLVVSSGQPD